MSNHIYVQATRFLDHPSGKESLGYRAGDDVGSTFEDTWDDLPDSDRETLRRIAQTDDNFIVELLEHVRANTVGMHVNGTYYDYDEIADVIAPAEESGDQHDVTRG